MVEELVDYYGEDASIDMCIEECGELICALSHYKRAKGNGFEIDKGRAFAYTDVVHAFADMVNAADSLAYIMEMDFDYIEKEIRKSDKKAVKRLRKALS